MATPGRLSWHRSDTTLAGIDCATLLITHPPRSITSIAAEIVFFADDHATALRPQEGYFSSAARARAIFVYTILCVCCFDRYRIRQLWVGWVVVGGGGYRGWTVLHVQSITCSTPYTLCHHLHHRADHAGNAPTLNFYYVHAGHGRAPLQKNIPPSVARTVDNISRVVPRRRQSLHDRCLKKKTIYRNPLYARIHDRRLLSLVLVCTKKTPFQSFIRLSQDNDPPKSIS